MSAIQGDVSRQTKVVLIGGAVLVAAVAYLVYSYSAGAPAQQSAVGAVRASKGTLVAESEHYGEVLEKFNKQNAVAAARTGQTYLSVFSTRPQTVAQSPEQRAPADQQGTLPSPPKVQDYQDMQQGAVIQPAPTPAPIDSKLHERLGEQAQGLLTNWTAVAHTSARVSEFDYAKLPAQAIASTAGSGGPNQAPSPSLPQRMIVPPFTLVPALLGTDIDTDENSMVEATIPSGDYAGATVFAMGYKRINNSVDMTFSFMKWNGRSYRINAKSIDKDTMRSTLSGDVNNRYVSRILLPAIAFGLGRTGQLFEQADSQTVVTPLGGIIQTRSGSPSAKSIAGTVVGGAAIEAGQVLRGDAAQQPIKQVLIPRNETIGVRFIDPVFASDEVGTRTGAPLAMSPAPEEGAPSAYQGDQGRESATSPPPSTIPTQASGPAYRQERR